MAPKRPPEGATPESTAKKPRHGFRVGPENLPDGAWRRKNTKIKQELIHKAKVKKAYAKLKSREAKHTAPLDRPSEENEADDDNVENSPSHEEKIHPTRQLMLKDEEAAQTGAGQEVEENKDDHAATSDGHRRRTRRPGYYDKQLQKAEAAKEAAAAREAEFTRRKEERNRKLEERQKFKKAMAKTRDRHGNKKLGRESALLLDKVRRMVGS